MLYHVMLMRTFVRNMKRRTFHPQSLSARSESRGYSCGIGGSRVRSLLSRFVSQSVGAAATETVGENDNFEEISNEEEEFDGITVPSDDTDVDFPEETEPKSPAVDMATKRNPEAGHILAKHQPKALDRYKADFQAQREALQKGAIVLARSFEWIIKKERNHLHSNPK